MLALQNSFQKLNRSVLIFGCLLAITACGNQMAQLPDDPTEEVESTESMKQGPAITPAPQVSVMEEAQILARYSHLDPQRLIQDKHLKAALVYFDKNQSLIKNKNFLSVIDFSKTSKQARFYIIDMKTGSVWAIHTSHGKGSDSNHDGMAEKFSNSSGSNASSLGFYLAAETYSGKYGLSLRLDGLSSTNSNARRRAVVIHGANYVQESTVVQGRSWGCPAVTMNYRDRVVKSLKGGSLIYAGY